MSSTSVYIPVFVNEIFFSMVLKYECEMILGKQRSYHAISLSLSKFVTYHCLWWWFMFHSQIVNLKTAEKALRSIGFHYNLL